MSVYIDNYKRYNDDHNEPLSSLSLFNHSNVAEESVCVCLSEHLCKGNKKQSHCLMA